MAFDVGAKSDIGKRRSKNEDSFFVDGKGGIFVVADGLGGHRAGEVASRLAVEEIVRYLRSPDAGLPAADMPVEAVKRANRRIYELSSKDSSLRGMGTTVVVALLRGPLLHFAHVGDSRAYIYSDKGLKQLTEDHTICFRLFKEGKIGKEMIPRHPFHGVLLRSVGLDSDVEVEKGEIAFGEDVCLVLCTDGLTDMVGDEVIEGILRTHPKPASACQALVNAALEQGGADNITVVVARRDREPPTAS